MPIVEITTTKSSLILRCIDYKEMVETRTEWLRDAVVKARLEYDLDDLQSVEIHLDEEQVRRRQRTSRILKFKFLLMTYQ